MVVAPLVANRLARAGDLDRKGRMTRLHRLSGEGRRGVLGRTLQHRPKHRQSSRFPLWNVRCAVVRGVAILAVDRHIVRHQLVFPAFDEGLAIAVREAAAAGRAAFVMDDDGGWLDPAALAKLRLQPKAQVVVLLPVDEDRIEAMQRGEIFCADSEASTADHGERARLAEVRRIGGKVTIELVWNGAPLADDSAEGLDSAIRKDQLGLYCADCSVRQGRD